MIFPVYVYGSAVLREPAEEIADRSLITPRFIEDMFETMYSSDGVGLAAPQVGRNLRLFVVDASPNADDDPRLADFKKVFINPEIYERSEEEVLMGEGCLSVPGIHEEVYRPERIRIRYLDENWQEHDEEWDGFAARVIQHEYDHLDGVMFVDRLSPLRKTLLRGKLSSMSKGKYKASYRTKQK
ncbi:peptide deformylase [Gallalistipes aquisgranensis]|uniref:peptide deformylase n=1 Tax=Gallalistipes aquisgranensis TaxID=2779358 RepID=UPI001CF7F3F6|nr:peptide deformylase [Gallalistipes aquisgranensis]MBE5032812.1 peptide deformylase [Gallalistipes aquisgranensis]